MVVGSAFVMPVQTGIQVRGRALSVAGGKEVKVCYTTSGACMSTALP